MSSYVQISLSHQGFKNLYGINIENDFTFSTGIQKYSVPRVVAVFFSPAVADLMKQDPLLNNFEIRDIDDQFHYLYEIMKGETPDIPGSSLDVLLDIAQQLGNQELTSLIMQKIPIQTPSSRNVLVTIRRKKKLNLDTSKEYQCLYENIESLDAQQIAQLGIDILLDFFACTSTNNNLESCSNSIFEIVMNCITLYSSEKACVLFPYIKFKYLESYKIVRFLESISAEQVSSELWNSLSERLIEKRVPAPKFNPNHEISAELNPGFQTSVLKLSSMLEQSNEQWVPEMDPISPPNGNPFGGVFSEFRSQNRSPINDGIVTITGTGTVDTSKIMGLLEPDNPDYWLSFDSEFTSSSPSLTIKFNTCSIKLQAYTFRTINYDSGNYHISSWVVEVSDDGQTWELVDKHTNCQTMNSKGKIATFAVKPSGPHKYVRFRMTGNNFWQTKQMCLSSIELFGPLI